MSKPAGTKNAWRSNTCAAGACPTWKRRYCKYARAVAICVSREACPSPPSPAPQPRHPPSAAPPLPDSSSSPAPIAMQNVRTAAISAFSTSSDSVSSASQLLAIMVTGTPSRRLASLRAGKSFLKSSLDAQTPSRSGKASSSNPNFSSCRPCTCPPIVSSSFTPPLSREGCATLLAPLLRTICSTR